MWLLYLLSWVSLFIQICFFTLSIACGLYYLAELVEEYCVISGKIIKYTLIIVTGIQLLFLLTEDLPMPLIICGIACNACYGLLLKTFPVFDLTSVPFVASVLLLLLHHYLAFTHFSKVWYEFSHVLAYFTVCLWIVPFALLVSLSANDNVLPITVSQPNETNQGDDIVSSIFRKRGKRMGLLNFLRNAQESILPQKVKKSF
ncbi:DgyrCDS10408 [Dimorphilus gyrociliatus]|uniref:Protein TEX261 n=1 Tax=Dimorphilus gyrociliatus TaxID=2664684 RepID=A0A7I8W1A5_9ANNE|nr:DgyrCDS10408 [Dimorphilus gyrociliatus]